MTSRTRPSTMMRLFAFTLGGLSAALFLLFYLQRPSSVRINIIKTDTVVLQEYFFEEMIDSMKAHEGYREFPYLCPAGQLTIGYGHQIRSGDPIKVSQPQADSMLRSDLKYYIGRAHQITGLHGNKVLAIGSLMFAAGEGRFKQSIMYRRILRGQNIDSNWDAWSKFQGKFSMRIYKFRQWQKHLYNLNY